jgi:hypothetical protein
MFDRLVSCRGLINGPPLLHDCFFSFIIAMKGLLVIFDICLLFACLFACFNLFISCGTLKDERNNELCIGVR